MINIMTYVQAYKFLPLRVVSILILPSLAGMVPFSGSLKVGLYLSSGQIVNLSRRGRGWWSRGGLSYCTWENEARVTI